MITCYFGLPGAGKSSMLAKIAYDEQKRIRAGKSPYKRILSNYYIEGCEEIHFEDLGTYDMSESLILLDEITLDADSRDFKTFSKNLKEFFILHRHYRCDVVYATQQYDGVDKKIRDLTHNLFYLKKAGQLTYAIAIYRKITITEESDIKMGYSIPPLLKLLFNMRQDMRFCWRPKYYHMFDSFDTKRLPRRRFRIYSNNNS